MFFLVFHELYSSHPKESKNTINNEKCQYFFSLGHPLVRPTYENLQKVDVVTNANVSRILQHLANITTCLQHVNDISNYKWIGANPPLFPSDHGKFFIFSFFNQLWAHKINLGWPAQPYPPELPPFQFLLNLEMANNGACLLPSSSSMHGQWQLPRCAARYQ